MIEFEDKITEQDIINGMEANLKSNAVDKLMYNENHFKSKAIKILSEAIEHFENAGYKKIAGAFLDRLRKAVEETSNYDDATKDLTSEQMTNQYKTRGWPFNAADDGQEVLYVEEDKDELETADVEVTEADDHLKEAFTQFDKEDLQKIF